MRWSRRSSASSASDTGDPAQLQLVRAPGESTIDGFWQEEDFDWGFLPPLALQLIAGYLSAPCLLRARLVCKHWQRCFAPIVDSITVVPEAFVTPASTADVAAAFPKASCVQLDMQDTFTRRPEDSIEQAFNAGVVQLQQQLAALGVGALQHQVAGNNNLAMLMPPAPPHVPPQLQHQANLLNLDLVDHGYNPPPANLAQALDALHLAASAVNAGRSAATVGSAAARETISVIPLQPYPGILGAACTRLRVRLPDSHDVTSHDADLQACWNYVSSLLARDGTRLTGLTLSTAPGPTIIGMLTSLTQLTSLAMDEGSAHAWGPEHARAIASLTNLRTLTVKVPPFRPRANQQPDAGQVALTTLSSWSSLTKLTKLHATVMRYNYYSSLIGLLPYLTNLSTLAIKAPQTRLPVLGSDRPLFANIMRLPSLTHLCLSLIDHTMQASDWAVLPQLHHLSHLELTACELSPGLNIPAGLVLPHMHAAKLRYPNSQDLVKLAGWTLLQRLDIKFSLHEVAAHQEAACQELMELVSRLPDSAGVRSIAHTLSPSHEALVGNTTWWSPLLPLLALPNLTDFRVSAKEGLASTEPILFDEVLAAMVNAWPDIQRLCFKGCLNVGLGDGWVPLRGLTSLQALELRHHPPMDAPDDEPPDTVGHVMRAKYQKVEPIRLPASALPASLQHLMLENVELRRKDNASLRSLLTLERRTTCRHFPEFGGMPLLKFVVSNCCVKAKGIASIAAECTTLTNLVFAVYKVGENGEQDELGASLTSLVSSLKRLTVLKLRLQASCLTLPIVEGIASKLTNLQRLKLTCSDGWSDPQLFMPLTHLTSLRKCSLAYFKQVNHAKELRTAFRKALPYCKIKAKHEE